MANSIPPVPDGLRLRHDGTVPVVNSRDVAEVFEKEHKNVLRDIDHIRIGSNLSASEWFREVLSDVDTFNGASRALRSFDLTRQGFVLLAMGWTGERAMTFKVAPT